MSSSIPGRRIAALVTGAALVAASAALATPASAAATITIGGTVTYDGAAVPDVDVALIQVDANGYVDEVDDVFTDPAGTWTMTPSVDDGSYALAYFPESSDGAPYSAAQTWNGSSDFITIAPQFRVTGGVASTTSFPQALIKNAGSVTVALTTEAGAPITGDAGDGWGTFELSYPVTDDGSVPYSSGALYEEEDNAQFDGTLTIDHVAAGTTYLVADLDARAADGTSYADGYVLSVRSTAGATTSIGTVQLVPDSAPSVDELFPDAYFARVVGAAKVGSTVSFVAPGNGVTTSLQWISGAGGTYGSFAGNPIIGATATTYTLTAKDLDSQLGAVALFSAPGHSPELTPYVLASKRVTEGDASAPAVAVAGTPKFEQTVTASVTGGIAGAVNTFQWYRDGAAIAGADGSHYTITKADLEHQLNVVVSTFAQGHVNGTIAAPAVTVQSDVASVKVDAPKSVKKGARFSIKVTARAGDTGDKPKGKVTVFDGKKKLGSAKVSKEKTTSIKLKGIKKSGTTKLTLSFSGTGVYGTSTKTVKIKVTK